ncbi:hypothetical protein C8J56DRAFT_890589 [Mycena floridula]|nr:hypothetical protein C8J56DRAFT_890589 [Mycena floridula]
MTPSDAPGCHLGSFVVMRDTTDSAVTDQDLRDSIPAYTKVSQCLVELLAEEIQSGRKAPEFLAYETGADIIQALKSQMERYTRQQAPFSARSPDWTKPMLYWKAMLNEPEARILAFIAVKIFSVLPNSMAEERTVSTFTRMDTADHATHNAASVVDQTKIRQYYHRELEEEESDGDEPKSSSPALNWGAREGLVVLNEPLNPSDRVSISAFVDGSQFDVQVAGGRLTDPFFHDLLSDEPITGADAVSELGQGLTKGKGTKVQLKKTLEGKVADYKF